MLSEWVVEEEKQEIAMVVGLLEVRVLEKEPKWVKSGIALAWSHWCGLVLCWVTEVGWLALALATCVHPGGGHVCYLRVLQDKLSSCSEGLKAFACSGI